MTTAHLMHVLLVEDNEADIGLTREALREAKVANELAVARDGEEALARMRREGPFAEAPRPDLVLLDLNLPRVDGWEVLEQMKADDELRGIPVAVLTTSDAERDVVRGYRLGANCYVTKPVGLEEFLCVVQSVEEFWLGVVRLTGRPGGLPG